MVGNAQDAAKVVNGEFGPPPFWGSTREVYRVGDIVYKVGSHTDNESEYDMYCAISIGDMLPKFPNIALAETSLHYVGDIPVIAMEFIDGLAVGECFCISDDEHNEDCLDIDMICAIRSIGISDTNYGNIMLKDGIYYIVDMAL